MICATCWASRKVRLRKLDEEIDVLHNVTNRRVGSSSLNQLVRRERQEPNVIATPSGMLDRRALIAASGATRTTPKPIARSVWAPTDHGDGAREWRMVLAFFAPHPYPRRRTLQVAARRPG